MITRQEAVASGLATALLAGPWTAPEMAERLRLALGRRTAPRWVGALVTQVLSAYRDRPADRPRELAAFVARQPAWRTAWRAKTKPRVVHWQPTPTVIVRRPWPIAQLDDIGALTRLLWIDAGELAWFADVRSMERHVGEPLRHIAGGCCRRGAVAFGWWPRRSRAERDPAPVAAARPRSDTAASVRARIGAGPVGADGGGTPLGGDGGDSGRPRIVLRLDRGRPGVGDIAQRRPTRGGGAFDHRTGDDGGAAFGRARAAAFQ